MVLDSDEMLVTDIGDVTERSSKYISKINHEMNIVFRMP